MKRVLLTATILAAIAGGGFALAQGPATSAKPPRATSSEPAAAGQPGYGMGNGMMGGGRGMMGGGMMGGMCPMAMGAADTKMDVKKIDKGVTITLTSSDASTVVRLQKTAEAMRLMHEAMTQ